MGLYLAVFTDRDSDEELDGVEVGSYTDFYHLREHVSTHLEGGVYGSRFPTLQMHADSDGTWSGEECYRLERELSQIRDEFSRLPPIDFPEGWQTEVARSIGLRPATLADCFIDVDGESLLDRLIELARQANSAGLEIWFQ